jgi:RNA polymerase sigma-70 factor (ECF subfamily)
MESGPAAAEAERFKARDREWSRLMAAAQAGDQQAYALLLRAILPVVRGIVQREHRQPDRAEDVVQDVLLTLHRVRQTYDPARPFIHWLATIARRRSIDRLRRHGRREAWEVSDEIAYEGFEDVRSRRDIEAGDRTEGLVSAIAALPEGQRQAIELLKLQELSLAEASLVTGRSIAALKVNVHRAMKALRRRLGDG